MRTRIDGQDDVDRRRGLSLACLAVLLSAMVVPVAGGFVAPAAAAAPPEAFDGFFDTKVDVPAGVFLDAYDPDGDPLTFTVTADPASGTLDDCTSGSCTYTPDAGFVGQDTFTFTASDGTETSNVATVTIDVTANQPPEAFDGFFDTKVDVPAGVFLDAYDPDGDPLTFTVTADPASGTLDDCTSGSCTYTPDAGFVGQDTFTFTASDGTETSNVATVTIDVTANQPPEAFDGFSTTKVDVPAGVFLDAYDPDGDPLTFTVTTDPASGTLDDCTSGSCTYTPDAGFVGQDTFTFTASDDAETSNVATVTIDVTANKPPQAFDTVASTPIDVPADIFLSAYDPDSDPLTFTVTTDPASGTLDDCTFGSCTYTPDAGFVGQDSFTFTASDGEATSDEATVTVDVVPPCSPATCIDNGTILLAVNPEAQLNTPDASGSAAGTGDAGLHYLPTGNEATSPGCLCEGWGAADASTGVTGYANVSTDGVVNLDLESFTSTDSTAVSIATIDDTLRVTHDFHPSPDTDDLYEVLVTIENTTGSTLDDIRYRRVMDWDIEPTPFAEHVTIDGGSSANLLYTSDDGFATGNPLGGRSSILVEGDTVDSGPDDHGALFDFGFGALGAGESVQFRIFYGASDTEAGAVSAIASAGAEVYSFGQPSTPDGPTLGTPNTFIFAFAEVGGDPVFAPLADDDEIVTAQDTPGSVNVLDNDSDPNGDPIAVTSWSSASNGSVACQPTGLCEYTPNPGFSGSDSFTYTIEDGTGGSATATVSVTVTANEPPVVDAGDDATGDEGSPIGLAATASDPDGDTITTTWTSTAGPDTDPGATCTFSSPTSLATDITCTDDGTYTATITVDDGSNPPADDSTTVTVVNVAPTVDTLSATSPVDEGATVDLAATLTDPGATDTHSASIDWGDGTLSAGTVDQASGGVTADHAYTDAGVFTVEACVTDDDGGVGCDTVDVTVEATPNVPPDAADDDYVLGVSASAWTLSVLDNDADPDGDAITITSATAPDQGGTVDCTSGFDCSYTPAPGFEGVETFQYTIADGSGGQDTATVTVEVGCPDMLPAFADSTMVTGVAWIECSHPTANAVRASDLTSAFPVAGDGFALLTNGDAALADGPNDQGAAGRPNGTSVRGANDVSILRLDLDVPAGASCLAFDVMFASEEYPEYVGSSFNDGFLAELDATTWSVSGSEITAPDNIAFDGSGNVISVNSSFFDAGRVVLDTGMQYDGATPVLRVQSPITPGAHALYLSVFDAGDHILDSAALVDGLTSSSAPPEDCVAGANEPPVGVDDTATMDEDGSAVIDVLANDSDADGDPLAVASVSDPANGTATIEADGTITYTPDPDFFGVDTFTYVVADGRGGSATATVTVTVDPVNDAPVIDPIAAPEVGEGATLEVTPTATDVEGDGLAWSLVAAPAGATIDATTGEITWLADIDGPTTVSFTVRVDDDGEPSLFDEVSFDVVVVNVAPTIDTLTATSPVDEGGTVDLAATFSDPGAADTHTASIAWGDGTLSAGTVDQASGSVTADHVYADDGVFTVEVCVTDDDGGIDCDTVDVTVANVAPAIDTLTVTSPVDEGATVDLAATFSDVGSGDTHSASIDWGDGTLSAGTVDQASGAVTADHVYATAGVFTVELCVTDDDGATTCDTVDVTVEATANVAPTADAGGPYEVDEGSSVLLDGTSSSDSDGTIAGYAWAPGDRLDDPTLAQPTYGAVDDAVDELTLTVTDDTGATDDDTTTVTVVNVAPTIDTLTATTPVDEGATVDLAASFSDPGAADTHTASIAWGDGTLSAGTVDQGSGAVTGDHVYTTAGVYTVEVCVTDDDGATTCDTVDVTVEATANVVPTADAGGPYVVDEGSSVLLDGTASTDSDGTVVGYAWAPGDRLDDPALAQPTYSGVDDTVDELTLTVTDDTGATDDDTTTVTVVNVAPTIDALTATSPVDEGATVDLAASFSDVGSADTHSASIDWGDGTLSAGTVDQASGSVTADHAYATAGVFTVELCVTDDDGATTCDTVDVTVEGGPSCSPLFHELRTGDPTTDDAALSIGVDATGAFGTAVTGGGAVWNPPGPLESASTVYSSNLYVEHVGALLRDCEQGSYSVVSQGPTELVTQTTLDDLEIQLTQAVAATPEGSTLTQTYELTNTGSTEVSTGLVRHVDGDLYFDDSLIDGAATDDGTVLYEFDSSDDPNSPSTFVGISGSLDGSPTPAAWSIQPFDYRGVLVSSGGIPATDDAMVAGDVDGDNIVDQPYDVTLSQQWDATIGVDQTVTLVSVTTFGEATPNVAPTADAGGPYTVDEGSSVLLDGTASSDSDGTIAGYAWAPGDRLDDPTSAQPTYGAVDDTVDELTLTVTDDTGATDDDTTTVTVVNVAPTIDTLTATTPVSEGESVDLAATFSDVGSADTHAASIDWGDGALSAGTVDQAAGSVTADHAYATAGVFTVELCVTDDDSGTTCDTVDVTVEATANVVPTADAGGPYVVDEGSSVLLDGTASTDSDGTVTGYAWAPGDRLDDPTLAQPTYSAVDDTVDELTLTVTDDTGATDDDTTTVTVVNVAPTIDTLTATTPVAEGGTVDVAATFSDVGSADTHTASIDWGDGTLSAGTVDQSSGSVTADHVYADDGVFTVEVCVTDDDGGTTCDTVDVTVEATANVAPTADAGGPYTVDEGSSVLLDGTASTDSDGTITGYAWVPGDRLDDPSLAQPTYSGVDDAVDEFTLTVTDDTGATDDDTTTVTVVNVAPTIDTLTVTSPVSEGGTVDLAASFSDVGSADTHSASIDWGDGSSEPGAVDQASGSVTGDHVYADDGVFTVELCVTDDDGGTTCDTVDVTVEATANVTPTADAGGPYTVDEGSSVLLDGTASLDSDGTIAGYAWAPGDRLDDPTSAQPTYLAVDDTVDELTLTVTDDTGATDDDTTTVTVVNVAPTIDTLTATTPVAEGGTVDLAATFFDVGSADTHTASIDWGDGSSDTGTVDQGSESVTADHVYDTAGTYTVEVCVTDDDGAMTCDTVDVTVDAASNEPPTIEPIADLVIDEGQSATVDIEVDDPEGQPLTVTVQWLPSFATFDDTSLQIVVSPGYDDAGTHGPVVVTVSDGELESSASFDIVVEDVNRDPSIMVPGDLVVEAERPDGTIVEFEATASDPDDGPLPITCEPPSGTEFPLGVTTVTCTAVDDAGASVSDSFRVSVELTTTTFDGFSDAVDDLELRNGTANPLHAKIDQARRRFGQGRIEDAINQLELLVDQVDRDEGRKLTGAEAAEIRRLAQVLIDHMQELLEGS